MNPSPTIMVSSTFYDLRQIRKDLHEFLSLELGYIPLLSEFPSFPVDPDIDAIENCRRRVEQNADIMVLVIGGRYGSIDTKKDRSVTNLEFLEASAKGIPIYVFVDKSVLSVLLVWKDNPRSDFSAFVDTPKVFEFIEFVRSEKRVWTFEFESAQDIITTLRTQFSYLFQDALRAKQLLSGSGLPQFMEKLKPKALRLALERPKAWEARLFLQSWLDEVENRADLLREYQEDLRLEECEYIPFLSGPVWFNTKMFEIKNLIAGVNHLLNKSLKVAMGKPGVPGDPKHIVWASIMVGRVLERTIQWAQKIRSSRYEVPFDDIAPNFALLADDIILQFVHFPQESLQQIEDALPLGESSAPIRLELKLVIPDEIQAKLNKSFDDAIRKFDAMHST